MFRYTNSDAFPRRGFTLIELLVVIGVIAILAGLLGAAVMKMIPTQQRKNTEMAVRKLDSLMKRHLKVVTDQAADEVRSFKMTMPAMQLAGGDVDRMKVIWTKLRLKQQFPMSYAEARTPATITVGSTTTVYIQAEPSYVLALAGKNSTDINAQRAACLLLALTAVGRSGTSMDADVLGALETRDTDGDGVMEVVDAWGTPLAFFRWPRGNPDVYQGLDPIQGKQSSVTTFRDPQDPLGRLQLNAWIGSFGGTFQALCHPPAPDRYTIPVITSAGPDKRLGYSDAFMTPDNTGASNDNINSYDLR